MSKPLYEVGQHVLVKCPCGCTVVGKSIISNVLEVPRFISAIVYAKTGHIIDFAYEVEAEPGTQYSEPWINPIDPPREKALDTLIENLTEYADRNMVEPA